MSSQDSCDSGGLADNFGVASFFYQLLKAKRSSDVTFILMTRNGDVEVFAHQMVLAMRSPHFADMFYEDQGKRKIKEKQKIRLSEIDVKAFKNMIRYCYDCKPGFETLEEICTQFKVAYEFKVTSLMDFCRTYLKDVEITSRNIFNLLEISEYMGNKELKNTCYKFLEEKTKDVMDSYEAVQVTPAMVKVILDLPKLSLHAEIELIKWLIDLGNAKVKEENKKYANATHYLRNFLQDINFLALTIEEFAMLCKDYPDFLTPDEIASICLNIVHPGAREMPDWYNKEMKIRKYTGLDLVASVTEKVVSMEGKYITDILTLALKYGMETIKCCSVSNKKSKEKDCVLAETFLKLMILSKTFQLCFRIFIKLSKMIGETELSEEKNMTEMENDFRKCNLYSERSLALLEVGGLKELLKYKITSPATLDNDEEFERLKKQLANEDEAEKFKEILENAEEYQRMKRMFQDVEEIEIVKILDSDNFDDFETERITMLKEEYGKFLSELKQLIEESNKLLR